MQKATELAERNIESMKACIWLPYTTWHSTCYHRKRQWASKLRGKPKFAEIFSPQFIMWVKLTDQFILALRSYPSKSQLLRNVQITTTHHGKYTK